MATVIDSLIVTLGLDPAGVTKGRKKATEELTKTKTEAQAVAKAIEAEGKKAAEFFVGMRNEALKFFAVLAGGVGIEKFVSNMGGAVISMGALSTATGVAIEDISAWEGAFRRAGASAQDADGLIQSLTKSRAEFLTGHPGPEWQILNILGITSPDELNDINSAVFKIADGLSKIKDAGVRTQYASMLGITDPKALAAVAAGSESLAGYVQEAIRAGVVTDEQYQKTLRANAALQDMKDAWGKIALNLQVSLIPVFEAVTDLLRRFADWAQEHPEQIKLAFYGIAAAVTAITAAMVISTVTGFAAAFVTLGGALGPIPALLAAIAAESAIALPAWKAVIDDMQKVKWGDLLEALKSGDREAAALALTGTDPVQETHPPQRGTAAPQQTPPPAVARPVTPHNGLLARPNPAAAAISTRPPQERGSALLGMLGLPTTPPANPPRPGATPARPSDRVTGASANTNDRPVAAPTPLERAKELLRRAEGFRDTAYWDVNAFRVGFGSDTVTDPRTGAVSRVNRNTTVTREQAEADLTRRAATSLTTAQRQLGARWESLSADAKAALASVAYNYGSLPERVTAAPDIAAAVAGLKNDNGGVNSSRRLQESAMIAGLPATGAAVGASVSNDNRSVTMQTTVQQVVVHTQATDAPGIAAEIGGALQQYTYVPQANMGFR